MTQVSSFANVVMKDFLVDVLVVMMNGRVLISGMLWKGCTQFISLFINKPEMYVLMGHGFKVYVTQTM